MTWNESTSGDAATREGKSPHTTRKDIMVQEITVTEATTTQSTTQALQTDGTISMKSVTGNFIYEFRTFKYPFLSFFDTLQLTT